MQVGDLVKLNNDYFGFAFGIILVIEVQEGVLGEQTNYQITWTDGDLTWESGNYLEVVCK